MLGFLTGHIPELPGSPSLNLRKLSLSQVYVGLGGPSSLTLEKAELPLRLRTLEIQDCDDALEFLEFVCLRKLGGSLEGDHRRRGCYPEPRDGPDGATDQTRNGVKKKTGKKTSRRRRGKKKTGKKTDAPSGAETRALRPIGRETG
ncbi:hypothetical protein NM208_g12162 [Fusarium decemcellulare]|uniref:Uncharacterized protein n=1 Tax=Fusarium decemcellulare TaxID=57161 RepID=A0ACC1RR36_9HYPO|nr:hypothetical protein NM208_g12162 [Fusarium decemcellulare]